MARVRANEVTKAKMFKAWLEQMGASCRVSQEDDGSGFTVFEVAVPGLGDFEVTVNE